MPQTAIWSGRLLVLVGVIGFAYGLYLGASSLTALIPAIFGVVLMALGYVASSSDNLRKHLMHAAVIVGLLGFIAALVGLFRKGVPASIGAGAISQIAMALICLVFVLLAVRSFIAARRDSQV
jgi:hypothetical protein